MKVLFQTRVGIFKQPGGDTLQIKKITEELRKLGVEVDLINNYTTDLSKYDLVHIFGLQWLCEPYLYAKNCIKQGKKFVVSPIHHSEREVLEFEEKERYFLRRMVNVLFSSQETRDSLKNLYRSIYTPYKLWPATLSFFVGLKKMHRFVLENCALALTQTNKEKEDLNRDYGVEFKNCKVALGMGDKFFGHQSPGFINFVDYIVSVGRIEPRKNQLKIIEAVKHLRANNLLPENTKLVFIGLFNPHSPDYANLFKKELQNNDFIVHLDSVNYLDMPSVYSGAKVCVSASWFETTGLTLLEAVACGCNVTARNGDTGERIKEYLSDIPFFLDPANIDSIADAIKKAYEAPKPIVKPEWKEKYTWSAVAKAHLQVYNGLDH